MPTVGLLFGMEESFPPALVERINELGKKSKVTAEFCTIDIWRADEPKHYDAVLDRISQDVPFYRAVLKNMMLGGTKVVNNPFWMDADEKFFSYSVCAKAGIHVPKTALIPSKSVPPDTTERSFRNLKFPLSFEEIFANIAFPAYFKPHAGGGWKSVYKVSNAEEFFKAYNETGGLVMTLQENIDFDEYYRCYCIGKTDVHIMPYEPRNPHHERYQANFAPSEKLRLKMIKDSITICEILGYDFNTIEFAVKGGIPYAIDFTNPAPDAELSSIGKENFEWMVQSSANFLIMAAKESATKKKGAKKDINWREMIMA
ncbi:MAG: RimK family alpha-L-glutamate ligase [Candidatus Kapaibacterium sp.]